jgi:hypothetical protein
MVCVGCGFDSSGIGSGSMTGSETGSTHGEDASTTRDPDTSTSRGDTTRSDDTSSEDASNEVTSGEDTMGSSSSADETMGLQTATDDGDSGDEDSTSGDPVSCTRQHELVVVAEDAVITGDWTLEASTMGEGMYLNPNGSELGGNQGTATFTVDVPCADDWYVWTRFYDNYGEDSWYIRTDGEPGSKEAIFEGDCTLVGGYWDWAVMNYREILSLQCTYVHDPWVQAWEPGEHTVQFEIREHASIARIIVVNDPAFTP